MALEAFPPQAADATLVESLTRGLVLRDAEAVSLVPFGAALPLPAQLVAQALSGPPPTVLHEQFQQRVVQGLSGLASAAGALAAAANALSPVNALGAYQQIGVTSSDPASASGVALTGAAPARYTVSIDGLASTQENLGRLLPTSMPS